MFGVEVPVSVPGVPDEALRPRNTWPDPAAHDAKARELAAMFADNFRAYADGVDEDVRAAGPGSTRKGRRPADAVRLAAAGPTVD